LRREKKGTREREQPRERKQGKITQRKSTGEDEEDERKEGTYIGRKIIERGSMREGMRGKEGGWWRGKKWVLDGRSHRFHLLVVL